MKALIQKYDKPGPRYTSYPPVPFWTGDVSENSWINEVNSELALDPRLDLYLHIPFCEKLCFYCGCNRTITKDKAKGSDYASTLIKEWRLYLKRITSPFYVNSIHFGGGTPTFLDPMVLNDLLEEFRPYFNSETLGAIEIDPRTCKTEHLEVLKKFGFKRLSLGIQDFDKNVQIKINRVQSFELVKQLVDEIRSFDFESLNFDLIYGLPGQSEETVSRTIENVLNLNPETIAFYSYAHLPERIPNQKLIKTKDLPSADQKLSLYLLGKELLMKAGYLQIGMDHFARPGSFLSKEITRSFMGYTDKKGEVLIGLGSTSIGQTPRMFVQNQKDQANYLEEITQNKLPISHGHFLSDEEVKVAKKIQELFCENKISEPDDADLKDFEVDGLVEKSFSGEVIVTNLGKNFLRNIAMALDPLMAKKDQKHFSRTV